MKRLGLLPAPVLAAPGAHGIEHLHERGPALGKAVLDLERNLRVRLAPHQAVAFDQFQSGYYTLGEKVGQAWDSGKRLV